MPGMNDAARQERVQILHQKVSDLESFVVEAIGQGARPKVQARRWQDFSELWVEQQANWGAS